MSKTNIPMLRSIIIVAVLMMIQSISNRFLVISQIAPDFFLMALLWISFRVKIENSTWIGFVLGMIQDAVAGSAVFGLSALTKSLTGYLIGTAKLKYPFAKNVTLIIIQMAAIWIHFLLYFWLYYRGIAAPFLSILGYSIIATIYTGLIFIIVENFVIRRFGLLK